MTVPQRSLPQVQAQPLLRSRASRVIFYSSTSSMKLFYVFMTCAAAFVVINMMVGQRGLQLFDGGSLLAAQPAWNQQSHHQQQAGGKPRIRDKEKTIVTRFVDQPSRDSQSQYNLDSISNNRVAKNAQGLPQKQPGSPVSGTFGTRTPTHHACDGYDGIFHIQQGDIGGAAGTIFFQFVIGQILYAERYNLKPWVYLNNVSYVIYDDLVHGAGPGVTLTAIHGMNASHIQRRNGHWRDHVPGPPIQVEPSLTSRTFHFEGTGVWEHYFLPLSDFVPGDTSCETKPLVGMDMFLITPGIHGFAEWAPRCWRYQYAPDYMTQPHIPIHEWLEPQRMRANDVLQRYIRFQPDITEAAARANPGCSDRFSCLGLHIRQSDKAAGRRQLQVDEFLPYALAFVHAGGKAIYLATDSTNVLQQVKDQWPAHVKSMIRTMGDQVIRSSDEQAVFDIGSHDRTNREILIEIGALAQCQFMVHGLSAVTESSIWINVELHDRAVNLEDPDHLSPVVFGTLVQMVLRGEPRHHWPSRRPIQSPWWKDRVLATIATQEPKQPTHTACDGYDGVLLISTVGSKSTAGMAFFNSILNQLLYAEMFHLKPIIHLGLESELVYDAAIHGNGSGQVLEFLDGYAVSLVKDERNSSGIYPGKPTQRLEQLTLRQFHLPGNGIWTSYFHPLADDVRPGDESCRKKYAVSMDNSMISKYLPLSCPWCVRPWRFDGVPDYLWWKPNSLETTERSQKNWLGPTRRKGLEIVQKYYRFLPHLNRRANEVNPTKDDNNATIPCLAIHFRNSHKEGEHRRLLKPNVFLEYMNAFSRAGGTSIFVATDSNRVLDYVMNHEDFPESLQQMIKSQGRYVVRNSGGQKNKWPVHALADHHRTNSENLVDILAMSKCQFLLHGYSTTSEAAIYLNPDLHRQSVNLEDPSCMTPEAFEILVRQVLSKYKVHTAAMTSADNLSSTVSQSRVANATVLKRETPRVCRKNAIIYLAQKKHSTYGRDSHSILMQSLDLLYKNYLALNSHHNNTDIFIFHTGDFNSSDLLDIEARFGPQCEGIMRLVDLSNSPYWTRPPWHVNDDPDKLWYAYPLFSEGYRHMMHWYAIGLWDFFGLYNDETKCGYRYLFRLDEDSFVHSPIRYDVFEFMHEEQYVYGYRMCAYEMQVTHRIWKVWRSKKPAFSPVREIDLQMCGFYNNFFVADISFFRSNEVQEFLRVVDRQGLIYRRRLGDLMIHSLSVYAFAPPERIHRFLDFTYQHSTEDKISGCVVWGGIEAGYDDPRAPATLADYYQRKVVALNCSYNATFLSASDLSPTYAHYPNEQKGELFLHCIMAGNVEKPGMGILSG